MTEEGIIQYGEDYIQDYDILYFSDKESYNDAIMQEINNGVEIYRRTDL